MPALWLEAPSWGRCKGAGRWGCVLWGLPQRRHLLSHWEPWLFISIRGRKSLPDFFASSNGILISVTYAEWETHPLFTFLLPCPFFPKYCWFNIMNFSWFLSLPCYTHHRCYELGTSPFSCTSESLNLFPPSQLPPCCQWGHTRSQSQRQLCPVTD